MRSLQEFLNLDNEKFHNKPEKRLNLVKELKQTLKPNTKDKATIFHRHIKTHYNGHTEILRSHDSYKKYKQILETDIHTWISDKSIDFIYLEYLQPAVKNLFDQFLNSYDIPHATQRKDASDFPQFRNQFREFFVKVIGKDKNTPVLAWQVDRTKESVLHLLLAQQMLDTVITSNYLRTNTSIINSTSFDVTLPTGYVWGNGYIQVWKKQIPIIGNSNLFWERGSWDYSVEINAMNDPDIYKSPLDQQLEKIKQWKIPWFETDLLLNLRTGKWVEYLQNLHEKINVAYIAGHEYYIKKLFHRLYEKNKDILPQPEHIYIPNNSISIALFKNWKSYPVLAWARMDIPWFTYSKKKEIKQSKVI